MGRGAMGRGKRVQGVLDERPEPAAGQAIVRVCGLPGGNLVLVADPAGAAYLCRVPARYRQVVWIKNGEPRASCPLRAILSR